MAAASAAAAFKVSRIQSESLRPPGGLLPGRVFLVRHAHALRAGNEEQAAGSCPVMRIEGSLGP
jgi:hypothetical protein